MVVERGCRFSFVNSPPSPSSFRGSALCPRTHPREMVSVSPGPTAGARASTRPGNAEHRGEGDLRLDPGVVGTPAWAPVPRTRRLLRLSLSSLNYKLLSNQ